MNRHLLVVAFLLAVFSVSGLNAAEPNYIRTTVHKVGKDNSGNDADMVTTSYSDGRNKGIQTKIQLPSGDDRVVCTYYDEIGRAILTTKPFVDDEKPGNYLPGDVSTTGSLVKTQLEALYSDTKAYSTAAYYADPLSNQAMADGPGQNYATQNIRYWYLGTGESPASFDITVDGSTETVSFKEGYITSQLTVDILDALREHLLSTNEFEPPSGTGTIYKLTVVKDFKDNYTQQVQNNLGQVITVWADPSTTANDEIIQEFEYDIRGNLVKEIAPAQQNTSGPPTKLLDDAEYRYNPLGQLIWAKTPDGGEFEYFYTLRGQINAVESITGSGQTRTVIRRVSYEYDKFGRQEKINEQSGSMTEPRNVVLYCYDRPPIASDFPDIPEQYLQEGALKNLKGRVVAVMAINYISGRTFRVTDFFSYDDEGRVETKYKKIPGVPLQKTRYRYDFQGKVSEEYSQCGGASYNKGYSYDDLGRLSAILDLDAGSTPLVEYTYDELGRLDNKNLKEVGAGYQVDYDYNIKEWLTSIAAPTGTNGFSEQIHAYDANGNITDAEYKYLSGGSPWNIRLGYQYDNVNRLGGATVASVTSGSPADYAATYTYDPVGRITRKKEGTKDYTDYTYYGQTGYSLTNRLQRAKQAVDDDYVYDKHGNLIVDYTKKMVIEYDWRNLPVIFRFFDDLTGTGISWGSYTGTCINSDLYEMLLNDGNINLVSTVTMVYDAGGNRVAKIEKKM